MKTSFAIALLLGASKAVSLRFAEGLDDNEDLGITINMNSPESYVQNVAQAAAKEGSGVRARWVELPKCTGTPEDVPLSPDLANATAANCKRGGSAPTSSIPNKVVYDNVVHPEPYYTVKDHEHQVTQNQNKHTNPNNGTNGPAGGFVYPEGTKMAPTQWAPLPEVPNLFAQ